MPYRKEISLPVLTGEQAPGPLHLLDELLADQLDAALDAAGEAREWTFIAQQALRRACGPGTVMPTERGGEEYEPKAYDRHKSAAAAAAQLIKAHEQAREAVKQLRELFPLVERVAELTAKQLDIPHYLPSLDEG